jgi:LuxR family maltose regulon positive regulatory protein
MPALIETDLPPPPLGAEQPLVAKGLVRREALFDRLSAARGGSVVLVCAPAGSGKSVLVRSWLEANGLWGGAAWVAVEPGERDGQRFWRSLIQALSRVVGPIDRRAPAGDLCAAPEVTGLLSRLETSEEPLVLVVDDLHELRSPEALAGLECFLARLPQSARVVLVTREDPRLGLHRLRLSGELTELRSPDLSFSLDESRELLRATGIVMPDASVALLHERTEGWAAGLRLAAISLTRHPDPERFVGEFSGSERTVASYLLAEVLERQPAEVRDMLLRTSVLERVNGPLADFLTGASGSEQILQQLEDANAFVSSLDATRSWFRYHPLFAELLQLELRHVSPTMTRSVRRAGAQWLAEHGFAVEAIRQAQAARDWEHASRLLSEHHLALAGEGRRGLVAELLDAFPSDAAAMDPELALVVASTGASWAEREEASGYARLAAGMADCVPAERRGSFDLQLARTRVSLSRRSGDLEGALEAMRIVESELAAQSPAAHMLGHDLRAAALADLGVTELYSLRLDEARVHLDQALALACRIRRPYLQVVCLSHLGLAALLDGRPLSLALEFGDRAVGIAEEHGWNEEPVIAAGLAANATALLWLGRLDDAQDELTRGQHALGGAVEPAVDAMLRHGEGLLSLARRRSGPALAALAEEQRIHARLAGVEGLAVESRRRTIEARAASGELAAARADLEAMDASERDQGGPRIAAAAVYLADDEPARALEELGPVIDAATRTLHPTWAAIEASLLEGMARERMGERTAAEASVERALELAERQGIILPFFLVRVQGLLERLPPHRTAHGTLLRAILAALAGSPPVRGEHEPVRGEPEPAEALSAAELRIVRYLPSNLRAPEIAAELCLSANTVRTHVRHIYAKLDSHTRNQAVNRARELGLLAPLSRRA